MASEQFLRELQQAYLKVSPKGYGEKVSHQDMAAGFSHSDSEGVHYHQEIQRIKQSGKYRFKVLIDDESITLFEPFF